MKRSQPALAVQQPTDSELALFSNLELLGFDTAGSGIKCNVHFEPAMFRSSQTKAADAVLHFLFTKWDANRSQREFAGLWPAYDARQNREFRKTVLALLGELEASGSVPTPPNLQAVLAASSGPRFVDLLWRFSLHCLRLACQRECQQSSARQGSAETPQAFPPTALPPIRNGAAVARGRVEAAEALLSAEMDRFLQETGAIASEQERWRAAAGKLTEEYRALQLQKAAAERTLGQMQRTQQGQAGVSSEMEIEEALRVWQDIDRTARLLASRSGEVSAAVAPYGSHPHALDGALLRETRAQRTVDLPRLVNGWARSMQLTGQAFASAGLAPEERRAESGQQAAAAAAAREDAERRVGALRDLVAKLTAEVASCKQTITQLQARVDAREEEGAGDQEQRSQVGSMPRPKAAGFSYPLLAPVTPIAVSEGMREQRTPQ